MATGRSSMRFHDWSGFAVLGAAGASLFTFGFGSGTGALGWLVVAAVLGVATRWSSVTWPGPMPHLLRWTLLLPRGNQSPEHLKRILEPRPGERILEIGPGIGIHAIPVASWVAPDGTLDVVDLQQAMLNDVMRRAQSRRIANIAPK